MAPKDLLYTKEHEWIKKDGSNAVIGITEYAKNQLGDIVFVELPDIGKKLQQMSTFGVVESVKAVSDLYAPISGEVIEVNSELANKPELIGEDPYGKGWIVKIKVENEAELLNLIKPEDYEKMTN